MDVPGLQSVTYKPAAVANHIQGHEYVAPQLNWIIVFLQVWSCLSAHNLQRVIPERTLISTPDAIDPRPLITHCLVSLEHRQWPMFVSWQRSRSPLPTRHRLFCHPLSALWKIGSDCSYYQDLGQSGIHFSSNFFPSRYAEGSFFAWVTQQVLAGRGICCYVTFYCFILPVHHMFSCSCHNSCQVVEHCWALLCTAGWLHVDTSSSPSTFPFRFLRRSGN